MVSPDPTFRYGTGLLVIMMTCNLCCDHHHNLCRFVKQDQVVVARLETAGVICLEAFQDFPRMARFILRDEGKIFSDIYCENQMHYFSVGKTIAIGKVLKLM